MPNIIISASRFNDLYGQVRQILGDASGPTYDWDDWYDEFRSTYWGGASKGDVIAAKDFVVDLYESNKAYSTNLGTRYGLYRKAKALGVAYWVDDIVRLGYSEAQTLNNLFYAASFSTFVQSDGQTDAQRMLTPSKSFLYSGQGTVVSDRGTSGYGYGATMLSAPANKGTPISPQTDKISDDEYINLYKDIVRIDAHQNGSSNITIDPFVVGDFEANPATVDKVEESYIAGLESIVTTLDANRFNINLSDQSSVQALLNQDGNQIQSQRSLIWRTQISHIFTVQFDSDIDLYAFFNSGGQIVCSPRIQYTGSQLKTVNWANLLQNINNIQFGALQTSDSNGVTSARGFEDLVTGAYTRVYVSSSAVSYANNVVLMDARISATDQIQLKLTLLDSHGENIDEYVQGIVSNTVSFRKADGEVTIAGETLDTVKFDGTIIGQPVSEF